MIGAVRGWLTSIAAVTLLLSVVQTLVPEGTMRKISGFTGGLVLLAALLQPVLGTDLSRLHLDFSDYETEIQRRAQELEVKGKESVTEIIEERTAAYISDKADALGVELTASVDTEPREDGTPVPIFVELEGSYSQELAAWITQELGIPIEWQVWHEGKN